MSTRKGKITWENVKLSLGSTFLIDDCPKVRYGRFPRLWISILEYHMESVYLYPSGDTKKPAIGQKSNDADEQIKFNKRALHTIEPRLQCWQGRRGKPGAHATSTCVAWSLTHQVSVTFSPELRACQPMPTNANSPRPALCHWQPQNNKTLRDLIRTLLY